MSKKLLRTFRKLHKWPGIVITLFVILFASSGIVMNHRNWVSSVDINRKYLHKSYEYHNWNRAAIKSACYLNNDSALLYGNIGVWLSCDNFHNFEDLNNGFPPGTDMRKISRIIFTSNKELFAGTYFGLYQFSFTEQKWIKQKLPVEEERITDLLEKDKKLLVQTRSYLLQRNKDKTFRQIELPAPGGYKKEASLFRTLWLIHSGELLGITGKLLVDIFGLAIIVLSLTGLLHFIFPRILRRRKAREKSVKNLRKAIKSNLKWHNKPGYIFVPFLLLTAITGMFLRPPLLIPVANTKIKPIPGTMLDAPNPWNDKLRRILWDKERQIFIFSTSKGIYLAEESLNKPLVKFNSQPPVSIMGCNVLEKAGDDYLVGSFSGLFLWNPFTKKLTGYTNGLPYKALKKNGPPVSKDMIDGFITTPDNRQFLFDYNKGAVSIYHSEAFPQMPEEIKRESPLSLWNLALEIHTGRIFEPYIGGFYILYIPLAGLCILLVLISGFFIWWMKRRKKS